MKLYGFPPSPNTWKVRAVAAHLGLPLELELVDLTKGAQRAAHYLALNPTLRTPTLVDGDFVLWESTAIMQYLAEQKPNTLLPNNPRSRADIVRWECWQLAHWGGESCQPLIFQNLVKKIMNIGEPDPKALAQGAELFHQDAAVLDSHLGRHPYLVNDTLTLADFAVIAPLFHAEPAKMPLEKYGNIKRWFGTQAALPAWKETAPQH